ncbi:penicillin-binding transpeptidase domain-containing protein [Butyrivibrio sp. M55]|uniref:penicillin-binding transpeptidase domain-containing protein n=1 Tax=Butyrivibrio sp. M55 TaxID=1855323 RepID=UPI0008EC91D7|nr:penicillin-binding transpeptidase domain-containing protein [Butyrivibrio sp. M55]SFU79890.1 stage V sporulation protein D (sporulation-specific penicillin-binding protein) [Butyrivibrio sp. M55]
MKTVKTKNVQKFTIGMKKKLVVLFMLVLLAFAGLGARLISITTNNGKEYEKKVLSQQRYDSTTIPYKRGSILDCNESTLAWSEKVYNLILNANVLLSDKEKNKDKIQLTLNALNKYFAAQMSANGIDLKWIQDYLEKNSDKKYYILAKKLSYDEIKDFQDYASKENLKGVYFEANYIRKYPENTLASDVIGFTSADDVGQWGLEKQYNDILGGVEGREYGYLDDDLKLERTTIPAIDGNSIVTTIDSHLQAVVEKYLNVFNEENKGKVRPGNGAMNVGCIMTNINTGEILAMASYPNFDLNNPWDASKLVGMPELHKYTEDVLDEDGNIKIHKGDVEQVKDDKDNPVYITAERAEQLNNSDDADTYEQKVANLQAMWKNFCISDTYEPGSVSKPITVAIGLDSGKITGNETYNCGGYLEVGGHKIHCHNTGGDGIVSVQQGIQKSCNVAMMHVAQATGIHIFSKYQKNLGLGLKTNIDLPGEPFMDTDVMIHRENGENSKSGDVVMVPTDLATYSFGQGYNCTMIEMITAFNSLINGGKFYQPHVVKKILSSSGSTIKNIEPRLLKQTVSDSTSEKIVEYCNTVTQEGGTGTTAVPVGYKIGGKTGTAEMSINGRRDKINYVVSFMGYAPADNPEISIYVVVDRPNTIKQDNARFATTIVHNILTEALPYLGYPMTEEVTEKQQQELNEFREKYGITSAPPKVEENQEDEAAEGNSSEEQKEEKEEKEENKEPIWKSFDVDPETGYYINPNTGNLVDPDSGYELGSSAFEDEPSDDAPKETANN